MTLPGQITGVHTVGVPVTDQDRAIDFYVGTLGFDKRLDADMGGGRRWIEVAPGGSATTIALVAAHEGVPAGVETGITAWRSSNSAEQSPTRCRAWVRGRPTKRRR
jgi:catechol 2,3-dioxygenase-like lactoylglutathione lyase family enzyme